MCFPFVPHIYLTPVSPLRWTTQGGDDEEADEEELEAMLEAAEDDSDVDEQVCSFIPTVMAARDTS